MNHFTAFASAVSLLSYLLGTCYVVANDIPGDALDWSERHFGVKMHRITILIVTQVMLLVMHFIWHRTVQIRCARLTISQKSFFAICFVLFMTLNDINILMFVAYRPLLCPTALFAYCVANIVVNLHLYIYTNLVQGLIWLSQTSITFLLIYYTDARLETEAVSQATILSSMIVSAVVRK